MKERELYSIEEARFLLGGISRMSIYLLLNNGELASIVIGRRRLIPAAAAARAKSPSCVEKDAPSVVVSVPEPRCGVW